MKLAAFLVAAFAAALLASPALGAHHPSSGGRSGSTIIAHQD